MQHPLLGSSPTCFSETESGALSRYEGFAADFFPRLYTKFPGLRGRFVFYRDGASRDLLAICEAASPASGRKLTRNCQIICLWNAEIHEEIGDWPPQIPDPVAHAIERIREDYFFHLPPDD